MSWKSPKMLVEMLCKTVAIGGNLLMNVGPCARGYMDKRAVSALDAYGEWMKYNARSIYGCTMAEPAFKAPTGTVLTQSVDGKRLYIHLLSYPFYSCVMANMAGKVKYAQFLHDGSEIIFSEGRPADMIGDHFLDMEGPVHFRLPTVQPDVLVPVIEVILK
jgi:alpha-L-fucosidase